MKDDGNALYYYKQGIDKIMDICDRYTFLYYYEVGPLM